MAMCRSCGKKLGLLDPGSDGRCSRCALAEDNRTMLSAHVVSRAAEFKREAEIEAVLITTEGQPDLRIQERLSIVTAECAYGMHVFKDIFAGVRNVVGGRSEAVQATMRDARETVLYELKREAHQLGANAVVAVSLNYTQIGDQGLNMVLLVAVGTAVYLAEETVES